MRRLATLLLVNVLLGAAMAEMATAQEASQPPTRLESAAAEYLAAAAWYRTKVDELSDIYGSDDLRSLEEVSQRALAYADILDEFAGRLGEIRYPASAGPKADALIDLMRKSARFERKWGRDSADGENWIRLDRVNRKIPAAIEELRSALGLGPVPTPTPFSVQPEETAPATVGAWVLSPLAIDPRTGEPEAQVSLSTRQRYPASLTVSCYEGDTDLSIDWGRKIAGMTVNVKLSVDEVAVMEDRESWLPSGDSTWLYFAEDAIRALFGHSQLVAQLGPSRAVFDITGAEDAMARVRKACDW